MKNFFSKYYIAIIMALYIASIAIICTHYNTDYDTNFYYLIPVVTGIIIFINIRDLWNNESTEFWFKIFMMFFLISSLMSALGGLLWSLNLETAHYIVFCIESFILLLTTLSLYYTVNVMVQIKQTVHEREYPWYVFIVLGPIVGAILAIYKWDSFPIEGLFISVFIYISLFSAVSLFYLAIWRHFLSEKSIKSYIKVALLLLPFGVFFEAIADVILFLIIYVGFIDESQLPNILYSVMNFLYATGYLIYAISIYLFFSDYLINNSDGFGKKKTSE